MSQSHDLSQSVPSEGTLLFCYFLIAICICCSKQHDGYLYLTDKLSRAIFIGGGVSLKKRQNVKSNIYITSDHIFTKAHIAFHKSTYMFLR